MRAIMIVDGNYLFKTARDFEKNNPKYPDCFYNIIEYYENSTNSQIHLVRIRFHDSEPCKGGSREIHEKRQRFHNKLRDTSRVDVILGRCQHIDTKYTQKGVDVNMALDIVRYAQDIDSIIVVSGDSDLVPAFDAARDRGAEIILVLSPHHFYQSDNYSESIGKLIQASDLYFKLTEEMLFKTRKQKTI